MLDTFRNRAFESKIGEDLVKHDANEMGAAYSQGFSQGYERRKEMQNRPEENFDTYVQMLVHNALNDLKKSAQETPSPHHAWLAGEAIGEMFAAVEFGIADARYHASNKRELFEMCTRFAQLLERMEGEKTSKELAAWIVAQSRRKSVSAEKRQLLEGIAHQF